MPQPERYYFTDFHTIGLKKKQVQSSMFKGSVNSNRKTPKINPGAYIFQRPFLRGLYSERLIYRGKFALQNQPGLYNCIGSEICLKAYSWKEIYVSNLQQVFTETRLEDIDLSKTQPCKYFVYMDQDYGKCKNLCVTVQFLLCFILNLRTISKYKPWGGLVFGGAIYRTFFCVMSLGGLYLERFIHGVAYFQNFTVFHVCKCTLAYL